VFAQLGRANAVADELLQYSLRRQLNSLSDDPLQRVVFFNASDSAFDDYIEVHPWIGWAKWKPEWQLLDEHDEAVPFQLTSSEELTTGAGRVLLRLRCDPGQLRMLRMKTSGGHAPEIEAATIATAQTISLDAAAVKLSDATLSFSGRDMALPRLELIDDGSDTWSHGIDRYPDGVAMLAQWDSTTVIDSGPLMACLVQRGHIGDSPLRAEYRVYKNQAMVELLLRVQWTALHKLLKLTFALPGGAASRYDGISGGQLQRPLDGRESPIRDRTLIELSDGGRVGVVCPDVYALDCTPQRLRLTLLRSPLMSHHDPYRGPFERGRIADQGEHDFRIRIFHGPDLSGDQLDAHALAIQRPPLWADLTRGMPSDS
jgi:hypothetical protein